MSLQDILAESIGGFGIYAIMRTSMMAVAAGNASEAQKQLIDSFNKVLSEYENRALLRQMRNEAAVIEEKQRLFDKKWGTSKLISEHVEKT